MQVKWNDQIFQMPSGTNMMYDIAIVEGVNKLYFRGTGTVTISSWLPGAYLCHAVFCWYLGVPQTWRWTDRRAKIWKRKNISLIQSTFIRFQKIPATVMVSGIFIYMLLRFSLRIRSDSSAGNSRNLHTYLWYRTLLPSQVLSLLWSHQNNMSQHHLHDVVW